MSPFFHICWSESKCTTVEAKNEAAARQAWRVAIGEKGIIGKDVEVYDAEFIEVYEVDEKGEKK